MMDDQDKLTWNQVYARQSTTVTKIDPKALPSRPTAAQIDREYTPDRVVRLARYIASKRNRGTNSEQFEEDVAEVTALVYERLDRYKKGLIFISESYPFYYWLLFDVRTALRDLRDRGKSVSATEFSTIFGDNQPDFTTTDEKAVERVDARFDLMSAMDKLSGKQKQVFRLYYVDNMTQSQVATIVGTSQVAVARILARGMKQLKKLMGVSSLDLFPLGNR